MTMIKGNNEYVKIKRTVAPESVIYTNLKIWKECSFGMEVMCAYEGRWKDGEHKE
jgi:hypothetical protein